MRIGFTFWYGNLREIYTRISEAKKAGFDFLEVSLDYPWPFKRREMLLELLRVARDHGMNIAVHGCWRDIKLSSPMESVRKAAVQVCRENIREAFNMNADYIVFHLDTDQPAEEFDEVRNEVISSSIKSVNDLSSLAENLGVNLFFENVPKKQSSPNLFKAIASRSKRFSVCLDMGHAMISEFKRNSREIKVEKVFDKWRSDLGDKVKLTHLHGIKVEGRCVQEHLTMEKNLLDKFKGLVRELKINMAVLEVFRDIKGKTVSPSDLREEVLSFRGI